MGETCFLVLLGRFVQLWKICHRQLRKILTLLQAGKLKWNPLQLWITMQLDGLEVGLVTDVWIEETS